MKDRIPRLKSKKATVREYLNQQNALNLPATYDHFLNTHPESKVSRMDFHAYVFQLKPEFSNDATRKRWFEEGRHSAANLAPAKINEYFPKGIPDPSPLKTAQDYINEQCQANLPATFYHFHQLHPEIDISNDYFNQITYRLRETVTNDPVRLKWFQERRQGKENLTQDQLKSYFPNYGELTYTIGAYLNDQCEKKLPATWFHFTATHPDRELSPKEFNVYVRDLRNEFQDDPDRKEWYNLYRQNKEGLTDQQAKIYFHRRKLKQNTKIVQVMSYHNEQFRANLPATYFHFRTTHPDVKLTENRFCSIVSKLKSEYANDPDWSKWYNDRRQSKNGLTREQRKAFFFRTPRDSDTQAIRDYLINQWNLDQSASWDHFKETHPGNSLRFKQFSSLISGIRMEFLDDPEKLKWFNEKGLQIRDVHPEDVRTSLDFIEKRFTSKIPVTWVDFNSEHPGVEYQTFKYSVRKWTRSNSENKDAVRWIRNVRSQISNYTGEVGRVLHHCFVTELYGELKKRNIPFYYETTGFVKKGSHPKIKRKNDKRVEIRILSGDILKSPGNFGPELIQFLKATQRLELAVDITLSGIYGKKIKFYADQITALTIVIPRGSRGQLFIEPHVRLLSFTEFVGPQWLNLSPDAQTTILDDLLKARAGIRGGPLSPAFKDFISHTENKWAAVKEEIRTKYSQKNYEDRTWSKIEKCLREGTVPRELTYFLQYAREMGHNEFADHIQCLSEAMAALGHHLHQKYPSEPKSDSTSISKDINPEVTDQKTNEKNIEQIDDPYCYGEELDGFEAMRSGTRRRSRQSKVSPPGEKVQANYMRGAGVALENLQAALEGARDKAAELGDSLEALEKNLEARQEDSEEGLDQTPDHDPEDHEAGTDQDRNPSWRLSDPAASDTMGETDKAPERANIETKHVFPISDAERAAMIAAANEIARIPLGKDQKQGPLVSDATRAEMIAAANAIACKDFPLDMPEMVYDKHEQKPEVTPVDGTQDALSAQQRGGRGIDGGRRH